MNIHSSEIERAPTREDAERALRLLRSWVRDAAEAEIQTLDPIVNRLVPGREQQAYPALSRAYPQEFRVDDAYKNTLPDLQNGPASLIRGAGADPACGHLELPPADPLPHRDNGDLTLETSVTGTVSLEAEKKGINMSRIMRSFYKHAERDLQLRGDRGGARRLQGRSRKLRRPHPDALFLPGEGARAALGAVWLAVLRHRAGTG
jgi:GTP cyclohydrolase IB